MQVAPRQPAGDQVGLARLVPAAIAAQRSREAAVVLFAYPGTPELALLVAGAGLGQALLKLGSVAIVIANEVRKELRTAPRSSPPPGGSDDQPSLR